MDAPRFEVFDSTAGEVRWRLRAANGEIVAQATEAHRDETDARRAVDQVVAVALEAAAAAFRDGATPGDAAVPTGAV